MFNIANSVMTLINSVGTEWCVIAGSLFYQGENESESPHLLLHWADGESQSLLQALHHLDQSEDSQDLRAKKHV